MDLYKKTVEGIKPLYKESIKLAKERQDFLAKPVGSLGKLEDISVQLAGITGNINNTINKKCTIVMAADNGVFEEGVASTPQEVTAIQSINMAKGRSGVSVLAKQAGADVFVVDIGIKANIDYAGIIDKKIRKGTNNIAKENAMTREEAIQAIEIGIETITDLANKGYNLFGTGEMGIGNTSTSSAVLMAFSKCTSDEAVGKGAGLTDEGLLLKKRTIEKAIKINNPDCNDPIDVISKVGGFDIAGLVGCYLGAAYLRVPIVIDGVISATAAYAAYQINNTVKDYMICSHCSTERAYLYIMKEMKLEPMLLMDMRLGEGSGCPLAFHIVESACAVMNNMATFGDLEVDDDYMIDIRTDTELTAAEVRRVDDDYTIDIREG